MLRATCLVGLVSALCILFQSTARAKDVVERPIQLKGGGTASLVTGAGQEAGQCSHGGFYVGERWEVGPGLRSGELTVANGATWTYDCSYQFIFVSGTELVVPVRLTITGGTGRFEGCTGWLEGVGVGTIDWDTGQLSWSFEVEGRITY